MQKLSPGRSLVTFVLAALVTATLLAPVACNRDKGRRECVQKCEDEVGACERRHDKDCQERAKHCAEGCER